MYAKRLSCYIISMLSLCGGVVAAAPIGTAFTYQGFLEKPAGTPVSDTCDFRFGLWNDPAGGSEQGTSPQTVAGVSITEGVFTATIDFGAAAIDGTARWLEIEVQCPGDAGFVLLSPRIELKPVPHALALPGFYTQENATSPNVIGGFSGNFVTSGAHGATIGGGGTSGIANRVTDSYGTVSGGQDNQAGDGARSAFDAVRATVGGGLQNTASGGSSTVGGGLLNNATGHASTVGGGLRNNATAFESTVPGGIDNQAGGDYSFAAGRRAKVRTATQAGEDPDTCTNVFGSTCGDEGTFVWADSTDADFISTGPDQFLIRAAGGVGIGTNAPSEVLDVVGNIHASGTIQSGSSVIIDGTAHTITSDADLEVHVADGRALRVESKPTSPNVIGGFSGNEVTSGVVGATIGGGGEASQVNRVADNYGTIGGGRNNSASDLGGTVGGGWDNAAGGPFSTVGGGQGNVAGTTDIGFATVAGGFFNTASGPSSTVRGGRPMRLPVRSASPQVAGRRPSMMGRSSGPIQPSKTLPLRVRSSS